MGTDVLVRWTMHGLLRHATVQRAALHRTKAAHASGVYVCWVWVGRWLREWGSRGSAVHQLIDM